MCVCVCVCATATVAARVCLCLCMQDPAPLPYLKHDDPYSYDINLAVKIVRKLRSCVWSWMEAFSAVHLYVCVCGWVGGGD